ncbi:Protein of unknown function D [Prunus dulcis]|uniref:Uncharacterized protein n=1 Tax=Prunus dulcis TaxID=3755 RepID=A0A4Y1QWK4_PRUDU|nr:Protein of unknown function D [Prunus dulcis]
MPLHPNYPKKKKLKRRHPGKKEEKGRRTLVSKIWRVANSVNERVGRGGRTSPPLSKHSSVSLAACVPGSNVWLLLPESDTVSAPAEALAGWHPLHACPLVGPSASAPSDPKNRSFYCSLFIVASLICGAYFIGGASIAKEYKERLTRLKVIYTRQNTKFDTCKNRCQPLGSEALPEGIVAKTSDLEAAFMGLENSKPSMSLLAIAVGIKQKEIVDRIVKKFLSSDFVVMLFHYDGAVDKWRDLNWSDRAIHVWFAKRFLHPDIVSEYEYIFLWDEDLGVENFDPKRYLSIVREEGLEISQPALDPDKSDVYHPITARVKKLKVHRRFYKFKGSGRCDNHSSAPPCAGWVEMMAPVFSRAAWQCVWYMIQKGQSRSLAIKYINDLIHAWGLDVQLGYCAQGDRTKNVGVVDSEYIVHLGLPTLGVSDGNKAIYNSNVEDSSGFLLFESDTSIAYATSLVTNAPAPPQKGDPEALAPSASDKVNDRAKDIHHAKCMVGGPSYTQTTEIRLTSLCIQLPRETIYRKRHIEFSGDADTFQTADDNYLTWKL